MRERKQKEYKLEQAEEAKGALKRIELHLFCDAPFGEGPENMAVPELTDALAKVDDLIECLDQRQAEEYRLLSTPRQS